MRRNKHRRVCFGDRVRLGVHVWPLINQWEGWQVYLCMSQLILTKKLKYLTLFFFNFLVIDGCLLLGLYLAICKIFF